MTARPYDVSGRAICSMKTTFITTTFAIALTLCDGKPPAQECAEQGGEMIDSSMTAMVNGVDHDAGYADACNACPDDFIIDLTEALQETCRPCAPGDVAESCGTGQDGNADEAGDEPYQPPGAEYCIIGDITPMPSVDYPEDGDKRLPGTFHAVRVADLSTSQQVALECYFPEREWDGEPTVAINCAAHSTDGEVTSLGDVTCYEFSHPLSATSLPDYNPDSNGVYRHFDYYNYISPSFRRLDDDGNRPYRWLMTPTDYKPMSFDSTQNGFYYHSSKRYFDVDSGSTVNMNGPLARPYNIDCYENNTKCMAKCSDDASPTGVGDDMCDSGLADEEYVCEEGYCRQAGYETRPPWMNFAAPCNPGEMMTGGDCVDACELGWCGSPDPIPADPLCGADEVLINGDCVGPLHAEPDQGDVGE